MLMLSPYPSSSATCFHLVRHGAHGDLGRALSGRAGVASLTEAGREQARKVAAVGVLGRLNAIHSSPRVRTQETGAILAAVHGVQCDRVDALDEIDFGAWTGKAFADLEGKPDWRAWNERRSVARTPGGETMAQAAARAVSHLAASAQAMPGAVIACVTHSDIIRGVIAHYLGLDLDHMLRFDIDPGSVSTILLDGQGARVTRVNMVPA
jgi:broad specificity phosphatase PhoE